MDKKSTGIKITLLSSIFCVYLIYNNLDIKGGWNKYPKWPIKMEDSSSRSMTEDSSVKSKMEDSSSKSMMQDSSSKSMMQDSSSKNVSEYSKQQRLPQVIIAGVKKCGTSALQRTLTDHSAIKISGGEKHYFDENYVEKIDWYRRSMPYTTENEITMEKSPSYFVSNGVPELIRAMNPKTKILLIVCDPVRRIRSDYRHGRKVLRNRILHHSQRKFGLPEGFVPNLSSIDNNNMTFDQLLAPVRKAITDNATLLFKDIFERNKEEIQIASHPLESNILKENGDINERYEPTRVSSYAIHFHKWLNVFPREQIYLIDNKRFIKEPWVELEKIQTFLELPMELRKEDYVFIENSGLYCHRTKWTAGKCEIKINAGEPGDDLSENVMKKLRKYFSLLNEEFYQLAGQNFNWTMS